MKTGSPMNRKTYYGEEAEIISAEELAEMRKGWPEAIARLLAEGFDEPPKAGPVCVVTE